MVMDISSWNNERLQPFLGKEETIADEIFIYHRRKPKGLQVFVVECGL